LATDNRLEAGKAGSQIGASGVHAELERVLASPVFRSSRKLTAFLTFVVNEALAGNGARIKSYTIGVEALGRPDSFDPQINPIVRVEAVRLRRALTQYYEGEGRDDEIEIQLARGRYVPTFFRRGNPIRRLRRLMRLIGRSMRRLVPGRRRKVVMLATLAMGVGLAAILAAIAVGPRPPASERTASNPPRLALSHPFPTVEVAPFDGVGGAADAAEVLAQLRHRLQDAMSYFDEVAVAAEPSNGAGGAGMRRTNHPSRIDYRLTGTFEFHRDGTATPTFRLVDVGEGTAVWTRDYERVRIGSGQLTSATLSILRQPVVTVAQPHGVIHRHQQARRAAGAEIDPRYACLLDAFAAWSHYDAATDAGVRACLRRVVAADPTFSAGFAALATVYFREQLFGFGAGVEETPALDRALAAAQRAVALDPESARARQALMEVHYHRGEPERALEEGSAAAALNPYDTYVLGTLGIHLVFMGEVEQGLATLRSYVQFRVVTPGRLGFALFLGNHLTGNRSAAAFFAGQITNPTYPLGVLARTLAARAEGDAARARNEFARLVELNPAWRSDPHGQLKKFFPVGPVADRLAADLGDTLALSQ